MNKGWSFPLSGRQSNPILQFHGWMVKTQMYKSDKNILSPEAMY